MLRIIAFACVLAVPQAAWAQGSGYGPKTQAIQAVERGVFVEAAFGGSYQVDGGIPVGFGGLIGAHLGFDIGPVVNLSIGGRAWTAGSTASERVEGSGDLLYLAPTLRLQVALLTTQRLFVRLGAEAGYAFLEPSQVAGRDYGRDGLLIAGAAIVEYYTKLRHFSVGLDAGPAFVLDGVELNGSRQTPVHIWIVPHVKYTF